MAAKKSSAKHQPKIVKAAPHAVSLRSESVGVLTVLIDQSNIPRVCEKFDPIREALSPRQNSNHDQLRTWAGCGQWLAIASHPEIVDADGVPSLDLILTNSKSGSAKTGAPSIGHWYDPVTQFLDLPTGKLCVIYDEDFFCDPDAAFKESYLLASVKDENLRKKAYRSATSYVIDCEPGFYRAHSFTRFLEHDSLQSDLEPELSIVLTPARRPKSFTASPAVMPYRTEGQDEGALRRAARGLPPRKTKTQKPSLLKNGDYKANVHVRLAMMAMELPPSFEKKLGLHPGTLVTLQMEDIQIEGMVVDGIAPPPALMKTYKEHESNADWFAMLKSIGGKLLINLTKQPTENIGLVEGESTVGKLRVQKSDFEGVELPQKSLKAKDSPDAVLIPKKVGKPGPKIAALIPKIDRCFSWTQICLFEVRGKQMVGAVYAAPPIESTEQSAEIMATIAPFKGERVGKETNKSFRGYPDGVGRAFAWIASHAKGGYLWTTYFEVNLDFFGRRTRVSEKEALPASIAAWHEIFGIEIDSASKDKTKPRKKK